MREGRLEVWIKKRGKEGGSTDKGRTEGRYKDGEKGGGKKVWIKKRGKEGKKKESVGGLQTQIALLYNRKRGVDGRNG